MTTKYLIGVDNGTQSSKVVIFDLDGHIICQGRKELKPILMPRPGVAEHPGDDLWDSIIAASREAMQNFPGDLKDILGVGLCTIRCCRACLQADGSLASPVLSWMDLRLARPYEHVDSQVSYVTTTSGYITHRFTGQFKDTAANHEGMWPIDKDTWQWSHDPDVFREYQIPRKKLLELVMPGDVLGWVTPEAGAQTGIPSGIPVVATANDKAVEALGAGLMPGNTALISLGTYIGGMVYGDKYIKDSQTFFSNLASIPNHYLYESGGIRQGMWTVSWLRKLFGDDVIREGHRLTISPEEVLNREAQQVPAGSEGLMVVPEWLAPPDKLYKRGIMLGFHAGHTRAHMHRAMLEAIALTMYNHVTAMCRELDMSLESIIVSGGGSSGDLFMQIFADVFGLPAIRNEVNGAASMGSAICAAVATEAYDSFDAAILKMVRVRDTFAPIAKHTKTYRQINATVYPYITEHTDKILEKAYPIFNPKVA